MYEGVPRMVISPISLSEKSELNYPPGNEHIPNQPALLKIFLFPKVGYVSFWELR